MVLRVLELYRPVNSHAMCLPQCAFIIKSASNWCIFRENLGKENWLEKAILCNICLPISTKLSIYINSINQNNPYLQTFKKFKFVIFYFQVKLQLLKSVFSEYSLLAFLPTSRETAISNP